MTNRPLSPIERYRRVADSSHLGHGYGPGRDDDVDLDARPDRTTAYYALVGLAALALSSSIVLGAPSGERGWDLRFVVGGFLVAGIAVWKAVEFYRDTRPGRLRVLAPAIGAAVLALLVLGASTQLVIDGRPRLAVSNEARAHALVRELYDDLLEMGTSDELLAMAQADARARYNSYEPAARTLRAIANRWARVDLGSLPDPDLIEVVGHVKTAATFGAEALDLRYVLITEPDTRTEAAVAENRAAFVAETLAAGAKLKPLAERYLVDVVPQGGGE